MLLYTPFLAPLDRHILDQNTAEHLERLHEWPPCWIYNKHYQQCITTRLALRGVMGDREDKTPGRRGDRRHGSENGDSLLPKHRQRTEISRKSAMVCDRVLFLFFAIMTFVPITGDRQSRKQARKRHHQTTSWKASGSVQVRVGTYLVGAWRFLNATSGASSKIRLRKFTRERRFPG